MNKDPSVKRDFFYCKPLPPSYLNCQYFSYGMNLGNTDFPVYIYSVCTDG
jgi:hypothetical protein